MALSTQDVLKLSQQGPLSTSQVTGLATGQDYSPLIPKQDLQSFKQANPNLSFTAQDYAQYNNASPVITPKDVSGTAPTPITPVQPKPETPTNAYTLDNVIKQINDTFKPLAQDTAITSGRQEVMDLVNAVYGKQGENATRAQLEADPALQAKRQAVQDLTSRYEALKAESLAIPLQIQQQAMGQGVTAGGIAPLQTAALRNNAIQALSVGSLLTAAQGNLTLALDQVDRAVKAQFQPLKDELEAKRANLEMLMNDPAITREESRRAKVLEATLNWQEAQNKKAEADRKSTLDLATKLASYGVSNDVLTKVQDAKSFSDAMRIAAPYMQDPATKLALENARLDNEAKRAEIDYKLKQTRLLGEPTAAAKEKLEAAKTSAKAAISVADDQVALIDGLLNSNGLQYAVGPYEMQREGMLIGIPGVVGIGDSLPAMMAKTDTQNFIGKVSQLISKETLDTLINLKKQGGTLGALSDSERRMLRESASAIGNWEIVKDGKVVGYAAGEDEFKAELRKIQDLARKAQAEAAGTALGSEDSAQVDSMTGQISDDELMSYF